MQLKEFLCNKKLLKKKLHIKTNTNKEADKENFNVFMDVKH